MSNEASAIVFNHSRAKGTAKVVMLGIANHDGDGGAWPSIATLARYANVDARNVQRAINQLVSMGELRVEENGGGTSSTADYRRPNLYHILLRCPAWCDRTRQHRDTRPSAKLSLIPLPLDGVAMASPGGAGAGGGVAPAPGEGVAPASPELLIETTHEDHLARVTARAREEKRPAPVDNSPRCRHDHPCTERTGGGSLVCREGDYAIEASA